MRSTKKAFQLPAESLLYPLLFFFGRIILTLSLLPNLQDGVGGLQVYYQWADLFDWAFVDYWSEYPPLFPWLNKSIYLLCQGDYYLFLLVSVLIFSLAGAMLLVVHSKLSHRFYQPKEANIRDLMLFGLLSVLPYTWWYFDLIPVLLMMLGLQLLLENKVLASGFSLAAGILSKWFPLFVLVAAIRALPGKKALKLSLITLGMTVLIFGGLYWLSPVNTGASITALTGRNSYETAWALIDGNMTTGEVFLPSEHADPAAAARDTQRGNAAVIPSWLTLPIFGLLGLAAIWKMERGRDHHVISLTGITMCVFFIWCSGWSPQWILFLLPLITLSFTWNRALLLSGSLIFLTILEWLVLLARHIYPALYVIAPLRVILLAVMTYHWVKSLRGTAADSSPLLMPEETPAI